MLDCYDGTIRGFKMDTNMRAELCVEAFEQACRNDGAGGVFRHEYYTASRKQRKRLLGDR